MYRAAAGDALRWLKCRLRGRADEAFWHETHLRFFAGFFRQRRADFFMAGGPRGAGRELADFMRPRAGGEGGAPGEVNQ